MKTQAWGWLAAGVVALGLNGFYHDSGAPWLHQTVDRVRNQTEAVFALATGRADEFLVQTQRVAAQEETASCQMATALALVQTNFARSEAGLARFEAMSAREQAQLARLEANRARMEGLLAAKQARLQTVTETFRQIKFEPVQTCPRVRVNIPRPPVVRVPMIHVETAGAGPV